jgi:hypothetical protein
MKPLKSVLLMLMGCQTDEDRFKALELEDQHAMASCRELYRSAWAQATRIEQLEKRVNELEAKQAVRTSVDCIGVRN